MILTKALAFPQQRLFGVGKGDWKFCDGKLASSWLWRRFGCIPALEGRELRIVATCLKIPFGGGRCRVSQRFVCTISAFVQALLPGRCLNVVTSVAVACVARDV